MLLSSMLSARSKERLGLRVGAGGLVQLGENVERESDVGMLGAERLLADGERALQERLGLVWTPVVWYSTARLMSERAVCRDRAPSREWRTRAPRAARPSCGRRWLTRCAMNRTGPGVGQVERRHRIRNPPRPGRSGCSPLRSGRVRCESTRARFSSQSPVVVMIGLVGGSLSAAQLRYCVIAST